MKIILQNKLLQIEGAKGWDQSWEFVDKMKMRQHMATLDRSE